MRLTGADILIECLLEQGVDTVFGYPGGAVLNIYDSLYKYQDKIKHILTAHEQGASHAADGYARSTGKVGVCIATSGPGATNLVTGIATAHMDSVPMVAITGNVPLSLLGKDSFQEVDITGITMPITKHNFIVKDVEDLGDIVRKAFYIAQEGRPGPVLIDIPKDITIQMTEYSNQKPKEVKRNTQNIEQKDLENAVNLLKNAKRPSLYVGGGVVTSGASEELVTLAEKLQIPVTSSLMGLGGFPGGHELFTGMVGMHGTKVSSQIVTECDLLIAVGARFSDRVIGKADQFAADAQVLQIDIDAAEINKNILTTHHVVGDIKEVLVKINDGLSPQKQTDWINRLKELKNTYALKYCNDGSLKPQFIIEKISELTKGDAVIATEVGQNQMWTAQYYKFQNPRTFLSSGGLGTMGYGLGASLGAKMGMPEKTVFNIAGDGCFGMNCNELATAVTYNIPVIIVILNNRVLGMVRQWQNMFFDERYSETNLEDRGTDFVKLAEAFGATAYNVKEPEEVEQVLKNALSVNGPVVINCEIDREEKVLPMVPPGASLKEIIVE
ncbi:biosynthetic-type acetolactate synthase large subunit [Serpentinicella sp. ANB-PHB4]|uniref:biosynthetic-type acetolactate synthase large subunit n=1 Tax=Serpentinicella sp. ANB-PHB4 TaxID=3074076 RepID=UPI002864290D|nr:biosynthetic-type acetolactate synthase large subunit [Serpentinicella sp. ANB-PHB4]MDR5659576.1 biosynthetic-type acetolactate synthase large subunit [Serpentinicella sp. ANB-PHB4]